MTAVCRQAARCLLIVTSVTATVLCAGGVTARAQPSPAPVVVAEVSRQQVSAGEPFVGTVRPLKRSVIGSAVDGRVVEFPINVGDRVEANQKLAQLLTETISLEVDAAAAELELRTEELAELENGSLPEEIEQARARKEAALANQDYLTKRRMRIEKLREGNAASADVLQEAVSQSLAADEAYLEAKAAWDLVVRGPRDEKIAQARSRVTLQQAVLDRLQDQLQKHTVITRFTGYVTAEHTEVGAWVSRGDPVAEVVALDTVEIEAFVLDSHVAYIDLGEEVLVSFKALPGQVFTGKVSAVVPQADERTRTFPVRIAVENEIGGGGPVIKGGMLAQVTLQTGPTQEATLIPKDALVLGGPMPMVYLVVPDEKDAKQKKVAPMPVEIGVAAGGQIEVLPSAAARGAFVKPGDQVVVLGNERLRPDQPIIVTEVRRRPDGADAPAKSAAN
jgi:RND family efflux transporter MFP subunit